MMGEVQKVASRYWCRFPFLNGTSARGGAILTAAHVTTIMFSVNYEPLPSYGLRFRFTPPVAITPLFLYTIQVVGGFAMGNPGL